MQVLYKPYRVSEEALYHGTLESPYACTCVNEGTLLAGDEAASHRKADAHQLAQEGAQAQQPCKVRPLLSNICRDFCTYLLGRSGAAACAG